MKKITTYLFFPGNCEEALGFYKDALGGTLRSMQRFGEAGMPVDDEYKDKIMHAELVMGDLNIMFSDGAPHKEIIEGNNVQLNLECESEEEQNRIFDALAEGGEVTMQLQDTFWNARFGQLIDKFGIHWMLNYSKE